MKCAFAIALATLVPIFGDDALPPDKERATFHFADPELVAELAAAEPAIVSPVGMAWDETGRMFVAEMRDYPNSPNGGSIRLLEDRDGDGRYEISSVFAENLPFPNSVLPWKDGVLVTAAPDLLFIRPGERRVLFTGFGTGNQQLRANGLFWGLDGWVYGANGRSDGVVSRPGATNKYSLRGRDFRFRPDTDEFETLPGRSQFGHARDDWGNRFLSWNTIAIRHQVFDEHYLLCNPRLAAIDLVADCTPSQDNGQVFPLTPPPLVFNNESGSHFNALAGLHVFRGDALGAPYRGNVFVGESLRNLIHRRILVSDGGTYRAERAENRQEFLASADPWFHPVNFATGPDGCLYVADFYRRFVEHPDWVPREMRDKVPWSAGGEHGRIWRIHKIGLIPKFEKPGLESPNGWSRDTAQRLILEQHDVSGASALRRLIRESEAPETRVLALHTLNALNALDSASLAVARKDQKSEIRIAALQLGAPALMESPREPREMLWAALRSTNDISLSQTAAASGSRWLKLAAAIANPASTDSALAAFQTKSRPAPQLQNIDPDRAQVVEKFKPALQLSGDARRGAATVSKLCLSCHYFQGHGQRVGPDLSGIGARPLDALIVDVLDPSRQIAPDYAAYEVKTKTGEPVTGLIASETDTRITIRHPGAPDESIPRSDIVEIRPTRKSLMPDGLENGLTLQDFADLLQFLRQPNLSALN